MNNINSETMQGQISDLKSSSNSPVTPKRTHEQLNQNVSSGHEGNSKTKEEGGEEEGDGKDDKEEGGEEEQDDAKEIKDDHGVNNTLRGKLRGVSVYFQEIAKRVKCGCLRSLLALLNTQVPCHCGHMKVWSLLCLIFLAVTSVCLIAAGLSGLSDSSNLRGPHKTIYGMYGGQD